MSAWNSEFLFFAQMSSQLKFYILWLSMKISSDAWQCNVILSNESLNIIDILSEQKQL